MTNSRPMNFVIWGGASLVLCVSIYAESKAELDLRTQLAASQAALAQAVRDRAALSASLVQASKDRAAISATLAKISGSSGQQLSDVREAAAVNGIKATIAQVASADASASAQQTAQENAATARQTAAVAAATAAQVATSVQSQNTSLMIVQVFGFVTVLVGFLWKGYTEARDHRWAKQDADQHRKDMLDRLAEVKEEAHNAYVESNTVNNKIASIGLEMKDKKPLDPHGA